MGVTSHLFTESNTQQRESTCKAVLSLPNSHTYKDKFNYLQSACTPLMNNVMQKVVKLKFLNLHGLHQIFTAEYTCITYIMKKVVSSSSLSRCKYLKKYRTAFHNIWCNMHVPQKMNPKLSDPLNLCHEVIICSFYLNVFKLFHRLLIKFGADIYILLRVNFLISFVFICTTTHTRAWYRF